ncbi:hypothetical protein D3C87_18030 [compost metagenome]
MEGKEFWFGFMDNSSVDPNVTSGIITEPLELSVLITARESTSGTISIPNLGWSYNFVVLADSSLKVIIPKNLARHPNFNAVELKGIHIESKAPISVSAHNFIPYSSDASTIYPSTILGSEYYLASYAPTFGADMTGKSEFLIVATEDNTVIQITPKVALVGRAANVMYSITLNKGETYQNRAVSFYTDVSGTLVKGAASNGTCKPFAVFSGSQSTYVTASCGFANHLCEQMVPTSYWGTQYFVTPFAHASEYTVNIIAKTNNTQVTLSPLGGPPVVLNQGQSYKFDANFARPIISTQPISVFMFMKGAECNGGGIGDPAMLLLNNSNQNINYAKFTTYNAPLINTHYVNIVVKTSERHLIYLDDALVPDSLFTTVTYNTQMSYAKIHVSEGIHEVRSSYSFQGMVYGMGPYTSYANNLGWYESDQKPIDEKICTTTDTLLTAPAGFSNVWWSTMAEINDTIGVGQSFLVEAANSNNIYVAHGASSASGCAPVSYFSVENPSAINTSIQTSSTAVCNFSEIEAAIQSNSNVPFSTEWSPAEQFTDPFSNTTTLNPEESGWYHATITSLAPGCYLKEDSVYITLNGGDITETEIRTTKNTVCFNDTANLEFVAYRKLGFDHFNRPVNASFWAQITGGTPDNSCGSHNGTAMYFNNGPSRIAETLPLDVLSGGKISFYLKTGSPSGPCDDPDPGENILLQYSLNNGASWTTFRTLYEYIFTTFSYVEEGIPAAALSGNTKFRLIQPAFGTANQDVWMLDNFLISKKETSSPITWSPNNSITNVNSYTTQVYPDSAITYIASLVDQGCNYTDSILILSDAFSVVVENTTGCNSETGVLIAHVSDNDPYFYSWESGSGIYYPNDSMIEVSAQVVNDTIALKIISEQGCVLNKSIIVSPDYFEIHILGDTAICQGDTTKLVADAFLSITDNFNSQTINNDLWWNISGGSISNNCSVYEGSNLYFGNNINRTCETKPFDFSNGGILAFEYAFGTAPYSGPGICALPANNQYVTVEYSLDNGLSWAYLSGIGISNPPTADFRHVSVEIPAAAWSANTKFRWKQNNISNQFGSNWMLDNVSLMRRLPNSNLFSWYDDQNNLVSSDSALTILQSGTADYTVQITDSQTGCVQSESVTVKVGQPYTLNLPDVQLCHADTVSFAPQLPAGETYTFNWYTYGGVLLNYSNIGHDSLYSTYIGAPSTVIVHSNSTSGCSSKDTAAVTLMFDFERASIWGDTIICSGASGVLQSRLAESKLYPCQTAYEFYSFAPFLNASNMYGSINGNALVFSGSQRNVVINHAIPNGGNLSFYLKSGDGINADATELGDDLRIEYSTNNGASWQLISTVSTYQMFQYQLVTVHFPPLAYSPSTLIRLSQTNFDSSMNDVILIDEITISAYTVIPVNYSWTTNNAVISTTENVSITPTVQNQLYSVVISDQTGTCFFYDTVSVEGINFTVNAGTDMGVCIDSTVSLNGSTNCVLPYTVFWNNAGNLITSADLQPQVINNFSANYILRVSKGSCTISDTVSLTVFPNMALNLLNSALKCSEDTLLIDMNGASSITWNPAVNIADLQGEVFGFYTDHNTEYFVDYKDIHGCRYQDSITISTELPISVSLPSDTTICTYDQLVLIPQSSSSSTVFQWNDGSNASTSLVTNPGVYWAEQSNVCGAFRDSIIVSNYPLLNAAVSNSGNVLSVNAVFQTYQWIDCNTGNSIPGETDRTFTPSVNGNYAVIVSDGHCEDTSACSAINDLGINDLISTDGFQMNFNPETNELNIVFTQNQASGLEIFDYSGKLVYQKEKLVSNETIQMNDWSTGIYLIRIAGQSTRLYIR